MKCGRCGQTAAHKTDGYAELVCSNSFRSDDKDHNAVGLLHEEMRRLGSLVMRAADSQPGAGRRRAGGRPRRLFRRGVGGARRPPADHARARRSRAAAGGMGQRHHRHRPAHLARSGRRHPQADRRGRARLLRRHRADRASRLDRHGPGLVPVALRQSRSRRHRRRLHQLPAHARAIRRLRRRAHRRRQDRRSTTGKHRRPISTAACRSR